MFKLRELLTRRSGSRSSKRTSVRRKRRGEAGFTLSELMLVVFFIALTAGIGATAWMQTRGRTQSASAARTMKIFIHRARMEAIYTGVNHFVVFDRASKQLAIYSDTGSTDGEFDADDERVAFTHLKDAVELALPGAGSLPNPLGTGSVSAAWTLPVPSGGAWTSDQRGVMVNPRGVFQSAVDDPQNISTGTIIFSIAGDNASAVTIRGTLGAVRSFEYRNGNWSEL